MSSSESVLIKRVTVGNWPWRKNDFGAWD